jgi:hypothetical protein
MEQKKLNIIDEIRNWHYSDGHKTICPTIRNNFDVQFIDCNPFTTTRNAKKLQLYSAHGYDFKNKIDHSIRIWSRPLYTQVFLYEKQTNNILLSLNKDHVYDQYEFTSAGHTIKFENLEEHKSKLQKLLFVLFLSQRNVSNSIGSKL